MSYRNSSTGYPSTYETWKGMLARAKTSVEIASYYWTLRDEDVHDGNDKRSEKWPGSDRVRSINMKRLVGAGILHTKLWITDREEVYVGSANTDWRSLSHVKELGLHVRNCSCLLEDYAKIFDAYWEVALPDALIPPKWPSDLETVFNENHPMTVNVNGSDVSVYLSSSPPQMCPEGRDTDVKSILDTIEKADHFIYVAVMDYIPLMIYGPKPVYWPVIDDALRAAAINRRVDVKLLISYWNHTRSEERLFLKSLTILSESYKGVAISVKFFVVPSSTAQRKIPFARVNHNKYMVTDYVAYIGTSNWSGDYFVNTAGVGTIVMGNSSLRQELEDIFMRDWMSEFAYPI
ncbi:unnamed protein product [Nesidiocoris tenuis]|uniref:PLD phosphodiesterase domain-containing protein n=1 Tax=Nesidiocoris tenuis TaxID=355587 RepID=A0A6H5FXR4_9HEMI|nr:unnamed protein product [Nesidiocoris tenuis]